VAVRTVIDPNADTAFILDSSPCAEPETMMLDTPLFEDPPAPDPRAVAFARQIEVKECGLDAADLFAILGVKRDATPADIDAAFDLLNRWFATERLTELGLSHLEPALLRIREHLRQAHAVLSHEALRAGYLRTLVGSPASQRVMAEPTPPREAATRLERPHRRRKVRTAA
jgi:hypothetical protein